MSKANRAAIVGVFRSRCGIQRTADLMAARFAAEGREFCRVDICAARPEIGVNNPRHDVLELADLKAFAPQEIILYLPGHITLEIIHRIDPAVRANAAIIPFWHWELQRLPESWRASAHAATAIWLPTPFVRDAVASSFPECAGKLRVVENPIQFDPFPYLDTMKRDAARQKLDLPEDAFVAGYTFSSSSCFERKNPLAAIEAFERAFAKSAFNAFLLVRCMDAHSYPDGLLRLWSKPVRNVRVLIDKPALMDFYGAIDVLLSLHRSEGYGLTIAEAVQTGARVITTGWGLAPELASMYGVKTVRSQLVPVSDPQGLYSGFEDTVWAEPDINDAADQLRLSAGFL